jgi:hypothetical protein
LYRARVSLNLLLDNETSNDLTLFFKTSLISYQYVPPNNHRSLPAERGFRTSKNHIIAVLSSCHVVFPSNRWPDLRPLIELTLNHLRPWHPNPSLSAWHGLHSVKFDFASYPIHPAGQLVVAHDSPLQRKSWAKHGPRGFYLSPAVNHYRCHNVFLPLSASYRVCQSLDHFPDPLFTFEDPSAPFTHPSPATDIPDLSLFQTTDLHPKLNPNPTLTTLLVPTTVSAGTAGVPPVLSPPTGPSSAPHPNPQAGPHLHQPLVGPTPSWTPALPTSTPPPTPSSPTFDPTPNVRGERYEGTPLRCPLVDSPHEYAHWGRDLSNSPPHFPPPQSPPTPGERRVSGAAPTPLLLIPLPLTLTTSSDETSG